MKVKTKSGEVEIRELTPAALERLAKILERADAAVLKKFISAATEEASGLEWFMKLARQLALHSEEFLREFVFLFGAISPEGYRRLSLADALKIFNAGLEVNKELASEVSALLKNLSSLSKLIGKK